MTSLYGLLRERCGLSIREAAAFHRVPEDTVKAWSSGRRRAPDGVIGELRYLYAKIEDAAENLLEMAEGSPGGSVIEIGLSSDDHEAQSFGWPCVGAHAAAIGLAAILMDRPVLIVPRGATPATAAATDAHDQAPGGA